MAEQLTLETDDRLPQRLALDTAFLATPEALDFVVPGLVKGTVAGLISPGGVGKTFWALGLALSLARGKNGMDLTGLSPERGKVLLLPAEDPESVLVQRLQSYKPLCGKMVDDLVDIRPCLGYGWDVLDERKLQDLIALGTGARLIILDTLIRFHSGDENSTVDMKRVLMQLEQLACKTGAAVLYLHHTSKAAALNGQGELQQAARGASVLSDNSRWLGYLTGMTPSEGKLYGIPQSDQTLYVRFGVSKQNYGAPVAPQWYRRQLGGALLPVELQPVKRAVESAPTGGAGLPGEPEKEAERPRRITATGAHNGNW